MQSGGIWRMGDVGVARGTNSCLASASPHGWHTASDELSACCHTHIHTHTRIVSSAGLTKWRLKATDKRFIPFFQPLYDGCERLGHRGFNVQAPGPMSPAQSDPFCKPIIGTELNPVVGAKEDYARRPGARRRPVAGRADDLWESLLPFLLRESVGKSAESWHTALRPESWW